MTQHCHTTEFRMLRELNDRRTAVHGELPYMTDEGLVMIDRREPGDRRVAAIGESHALASARFFDLISR